MTTTLTQASQQWMSRPADQRFLSLVEMQAFKSRIRDNSATQIISSRSLQLQPSGESAHALQIIGPNGEPAASTHWSFGQLCSLASPGNSPASYFRCAMPSAVNDFEIEERCYGDGSIGLPISIAVSLLQNDAAVFDQRQRRARDVICRHETEHQGISDTK